MRLRLDYWIDSRPDVKCTDPDNGIKLVRSATFSVNQKNHHYAENVPAASRRKHRVDLNRLR
jgi:hypothetical protein